MTNEPNSTNPIWTEISGDPHRVPLAENVTCDVCVVGAGITGITTAYLLGLTGHSVVVIDSGVLGSGETGRTTAHLSNALDDRYYELESLHGAEGAKLAAESHTAAIDRIESIVRNENIDCNFTRVDGFLFSPEPDGRQKLEAELAAAHRAGLHSVELLSRLPLPSIHPGSCLKFPNQAQFHPLRYLSGLASATEQHGGRIFLHTHATAIEDGHPCTVKTASGHTITATFVVVATNSPVNDIVTMHTKQAPYRTYAIGARIPKNSLEPALYWDTLHPYHYVRIHPMDTYDVLIVGGEDHKTGQDHPHVDRFARLDHWIRERFPMAQEIVYSWSGQVMEPVDGLAFIGRNPGEQSVFIATGDSGNGMTHGTIAGMLITDLIGNRTNPWTSLYDPARINIRSLGKFADENINVAAQYAAFLTPGDVDTLGEIVPGCGAVIREGFGKIAVYRDDEGKVHRFDARCPHLGCIVAWNSTESTWDCPCHGSRFAARGEVITGPAISGLTQVGA